MKNSGKIVDGVELKEISIMEGTVEAIATNNLILL